MAETKVNTSAFGERLEILIKFLLENEEPVKATLAKRLKIPPKTLFAWLHGQQKSIHRYENLAAIARVSEKTMESYLHGEVSFEDLLQERKTDSPLQEILRKIDKLSERDVLELNWILAGRLREPAYSGQSKSGHNFISFELNEINRLQRYLDAVKKTHGGSEELIAAAVAAGASDEEARALVGDVLLGEVSREYCADNFKYFLSFLPKIIGWKGDNPVLSRDESWKDFEEMIAEIKRPSHTVRLQRSVG